MVDVMAVPGSEEELLLIEPFEARFDEAEGEDPNWDDGEEEEWEEEEDEWDEDDEWSDDDDEEWDEDEEWEEGEWEEEEE
jgi:hypothetical protein